MTRSPNPGAVYASAATVLVNAVDHQVDVIFPLIDQIVPKKNLAVARTVHLHVGVARVMLNCLGATENHDATTAVHDLGPHFATAGIDADALPGNAGLRESRRHAVRCPRFLRARLENESDLHRDYG